MSNYEIVFLMAMFFMVNVLPELLRPKPSEEDKLETSKSCMLPQEDTIQTKIFNAGGILNYINNNKS